MYKIQTMKKFILLLVAGFSLYFFSCRKDMTCTCESKTDYTAPSGAGTITTTDTKNLKNVKKSEGRVNCLSKKYAFTYYTILGDSVTDTKITCTLN